MDEEYATPKNQSLTDRTLAAMIPTSIQIKMVPS